MSMIRQTVKHVFSLTFIIGLVFASSLYAQVYPASDLQQLYAQYNQFKQAGKYAQALDMQDQLVAMTEQNFGPDHQNLVNLWYDLATLNSALGRYDKGADCYQKAMSIEKKILGDTHPTIAMRMNNLAEFYRSLGQFEKARPLYENALNIYQANAKKDQSLNADKASVLNNLALLDYTMGDYRSAQGLYQKALDLFESIFGQNHEKTATALNNLAELYRTTGQYAKARALYDRSMEIYAHVSGKDSLNYAVTLNNLGLLCYLEGDYDTAKKKYDQALEIRKQKLGPENPEVAGTLINLSQLQMDWGHYDQARLMIDQALAIYKKTFGPNHPQYATALFHMAGYYQTISDFNQARNLYEKVLDIDMASLGQDHPQVATALDSLGMLNFLQGNYEKAESLFSKAQDIYKNAYGPDHVYCAQNLNHLAEVYATIGDVKKASNYYLTSIEISEKALGPDHPDIAAALNNLANLHVQAQEYETAQKLFEQALKIFESHFGKDHRDVATCLNNLGHLEDLMGNPQRAKILLEQSLAVSEKSLGSNDLLVSKILNNLSSVQIRTRNYKEAAAGFEKSYRILSNIYGLHHPIVSDCYSNLALAYAALKDMPKAYDYQKNAQDIDLSMLDQVMGFTTQAQKLAYLRLKQNSLFVYLNMTVQDFSNDNQKIKQALDIWLKRKGFVLEANKSFQKALIYSDNPEATALFDELSAVRKHISKLFFTDPVQYGQKAYQERIAQLYAKKQDLEARLSKISKSFALSRTLSKVDSRKIVAALPENSALVEFIEADMFDFNRIGQKDQWQPAHYLAFVALSKHPDDIHLIDIGTQAQIDGLIESCKELVMSRQKIKFMELKKTLRQLYDQVFLPLKAKLKTSTTLFISPDGNLNLIPLEMLCDPDDQFLIDQYTFNYLANGRDLLGFGQDRVKHGKSLIIGNPDFNLADEKKKQKDKSENVKNKNEKKSKKLDLPGSPKGYKRSFSMRDMHFSLLPGTLAEVSAIRDLIGKNNAVVFTGKQATEDVLWKISSPRILHLATHGFFIDDQQQDTIAFNELLTTLNANTESKPRGETGFAPIENPLLRSGIVFAGANTSLKSKNTTDANGIVTAEKILGLKLSGTDMVVLSACETGLGKVEAGEGVFGLRRAFLQAGAKSLVMSMWSVPDQETMELMVQFYKNMVSGKYNRCQALRMATLSQKKLVEKRYGYASPYYWAPFIFLGQP